jgi:NNP family nitrate/nitrite transporter-like MFS transporter
LPTALGQRGIDPVTSGAYAAAVTIGNLIGCLSAPILTVKIGKIKPVMIVFAGVSVAGAAFGWTAPPGILLGACLFVTGVAMGGLMPLLMSIPVQLPEIGPVYAGTAGGFTGTLQLLGAVVIPTYIAAPIAGSNMNLFFLLGGACMTLVFALVFVLPELGGKNAV